MKPTNSYQLYLENIKPTWNNSCKYFDISAIDQVAYKSIILLFEQRDEFCFCTREITRKNIRSEKNMVKMNIISCSTKPGSLPLHHNWQTEKSLMWRDSSVRLGVIFTHILVQSPVHLSVPQNYRPQILIIFQTEQLR